ncbi:M15 family metallopeptidase [Rubellimicrobium arenae]|uniref:M15 family metallopeptidase n=1 Tax=Rubellimicrobium arenae TaxID=2817372 RepID=UPI001B30CB97|nr:M15 family metallopeptidase [Rubellimicrobium arenae]
MRRGSLAGATVIAIGLVAAAIAFAVVTSLLDTADATTDLRLSRIEQALADSDRRARDLGEDLAEARADVARLRDDLTVLANRPPPLSTAPAAPAGPVDAGQVIDPEAGGGEDFEAPQETQQPTEVMLLAKQRFNKGITQPRNRTMIEILGQPRDSYGTDCQPVTNPRLRSLLDTRQVGPIQVTMLRPALDSLERVLTRLQANEPDIYAKLGTAGALCARFIRGSTSSISNHSWGTAIDLTLAGELDGFADGGTQLGLVLLAEYFNEEGWFWGATYGREDSMHFEVGEETLRAWAAEGQI